MRAGTITHRSPPVPCPAAPSRTWFTTLGHIVIQMRLSSYASGQPKLTMTPANGEIEELTIEVPGFDLRAYDGDHGWSRLHLVFRSPDRASLLAGCEVVQLTPHLFHFSGSGQPALQIVWLATPAGWTPFRKEAMAHE